MQLRFLFLIIFSTSYGSPVGSIKKNIEIDSKKQSIIDPVEIKIHCGPVFGDESTKIIITNPKSNKILKGTAAFAVTFDNYDSLKVQNIKLRWIKLRDSITNNNVLSYLEFEDMSGSEKADVTYYKVELEKIILQYKFWTEKNDHGHKLKEPIKYLFTFSFIVKPNN